MFWGWVGWAAPLRQKLLSLGHEVKIGSRSASNEKAVAWVMSSGARASYGTFADSARFAELLFLCTPGDVSLEVLESAGSSHLAGKTLVDVSNPLQFSKGAPPPCSSATTILWASVFSARILSSTWSRR